MRMTLNIAGVVALLLGLLWILQGSNILAGSAMSGQSTWLYIGIMLVLVAIGLFYTASRRRSTP